MMPLVESTLKCASACGKLAIFTRPEDLCPTAWEVNCKSFSSFSEAESLGFDGFGLTSS
jgi:hypothetical protein